MTSKSAVITGLGVVAATGSTVEEYWKATLAGAIGIRRIDRFDPSAYATQLAGQISRYAEEQVPGRIVPQSDRWTHLALAAAVEALGDAQISTDGLGTYEGAVVTSSSSGGTHFGQEEMTRLYRQGPRQVSAYQSIAWFYAATTGQLSIRHQLRGASGVVVAEQAGGLAAIDRAAHIVTGSDPEVRVVLTGGTDSAMCPYALAAQLTSGRLSNSDDPNVAYAPFTTAATGHVPGEGGALLVVESSERHGGPPYAEIAGYGASFDPPPGSGRPRTLEAAIRSALLEAKSEKEDIDAVFADASGVPEDDSAEAAAIERVFGPGMPVTAPKAGVGRLYGGGAPLDVATACLALRHQVLPPTPGAGACDSQHHIDLNREASPRRLRAILVIARGHPGFNGALVLRRGATSTTSIYPPTQPTGGHHGIQ